MKATTKISLFLGSLVSMIPFVLLGNVTGLLLTAICFLWTIELSDWIFDEEI